MKPNKVADVLEVMIAWGKAFQQGRYAEALAEVKSAQAALLDTAPEGDIDFLKRLERHCHSRLSGELPADVKSPCSFCGRRLAPETAAVLGVDDSICVSCILQARNLVEGGQAPDAGLSIVAGEGLSCSFCRLSRSADVIVGLRARICRPCVGIAVAEVGEQGTTAS